VTKHDSLGFKIAVLALVLTLGGLATASGAGKPTSCSNVPTTFQFMTPTAALPAISQGTDDSNPAIVNSSPYQDGFDGVSAPIFYNKDCNGSRDARLDLGASTRTLTMQFPTAIDGSIIQRGPASFAGNAAFQTHAVFLIRNIVGHNTPGITPSEGTTQGVAATYYTKVRSPFTGPDGQSYVLVFWPDYGTCPGTCVSVTDSTGSFDNSPQQTAWAKVTYMPRDVSKPWSATNADSWFVEGEVVTTEPSPPAIRSTLYGPDLPGPSGKTRGTVHYGQYSMPYKVLVTALAPLQ
jgi:hypothetical protein